MQPAPGMPPLGVSSMHPQKHAGGEDSVLAQEPCALWLDSLPWPQPASSEDVPDASLREASPAGETGTCITLQPSLCPLEGPGKARRAHARHLCVTRLGHVPGPLCLRFPVCLLSQTDEVRWTGQGTYLLGWGK